MNDRILYQGKWLTMKQRGRWEYVERVNPGGAVAILAITDEQRIVLVEQPRVPISRTTIELPAGLVGDLEHRDDEDLLNATQRELEEETGYRCERIEPLHSGPSSAGMSTEIIHYVRALDLKRVSQGGGDATEDITVHEVPLVDISTWLAQRAAQGDSIDPKLMAGLWLLAHPGRYNAPQG
ncbi:MAG: NUDIX hydrolase [Rhodanobacteraceae bacterium]